MDINHMLVYGTLRRGQGANYMMEKYGTYVETVDLPGARMFSLGGFPGIRLDGTGSIECDLYRIDDPTLIQVADRYEGYDDSSSDPLYFRRIVSVNDIPAYIYEFNGDSHATIESGNWLKR